MRSSTSSGFSLIELLVVIVIITILGAVVAMNVGGAPDTARVASTRANIHILKTCIARYQLDNGRIPTESQGLAALCVKPTVDPIPTVFPVGGYLDVPHVPQDGWKHDFIYTVADDGVRYEIRSYGKDGEPGGTDVNADLSSNDP